MTLPIPGGDRQTLRASLRRLVALIRRHYGRFDYLAVYEVGAKTGVGHLHVVFYGTFIPQGWLSAAWEDISGFAVVDVRAADGEVVTYMVKTLVGYLSKDDHGGRMMRSKGWAPTAVLPLHERVLLELGRARVHLT
jgi:hypothetical protein